MPDQGKHYKPILLKINKIGTHSLTNFSVSLKEINRNLTLIMLCVGCMCWIAENRSVKNIVVNQRKPILSFFSYILSNDLQSLLNVS